MAPLNPEVASEADDERRLQMALMLAAAAYRKDEVRLASDDLDDCEWLVASRQGLFALGSQGARLLAYGFFFGIALDESAIFLFEACDAPASSTRMGRIVRLTIGGRRIVRADVVARCLDNGCHQIDLVGDHLCVIDTYNQQLVLFDRDFRQTSVLSPLPVARATNWGEGYLHCNSLLALPDSVLLLAHNGGRATNKPSEVIQFDRDWAIVDRGTLPGLGCHNIAVIEDGTILSCGSVAGELVTMTGPVAAISTRMTRGLAVGRHNIAVGASDFSVRRKRLFVPGTVTILDRAYGRLCDHEIPGAPTDIRRLDQIDFGQSAFVSATMAGSVRPRVHV